MKEAVILLIFCCVFAMVQADVAIDPNSFISCYQLDPTARDFSSYSGVPDISYMTPSYCIKACYSLGFSFASVEASYYCFCANQLPQKAANISDASCQSNCTDFNLACPGDASRCCGSSSIFMVYRTVPTLQVRIVKTVFCFRF